MSRREYRDVHGKLKGYSQNSSDRKLPFGKIGVVIALLWVAYDLIKAHL